MNFDCIIIGGGAAGMMSAITAARNGLQTAIVEHSDRIGKKILQTGNGKCNLTNLLLEDKCYLSDDKQFIMDVIEQFSVNDTLEFFKNIGILPKNKNGYIYPNSEQASSVLDVLRFELEHLQVSILTQIKIQTIEKTKKGFQLIGSSDKLFCKTLIIATGSKAAPKTGSDGSGYLLAKQFGHTIVKPLPALVQLKSDLSIFKMISGVRAEGTVKLLIDGKYVASDRGEIQFTDYGISGIPVFQISRYAVRAVDGNRKTEILIDLLPGIESADLLNLLHRRIPEEGYKTFEQFFTGLLNKKLIGAILKRLQINLNDIVTNHKDSLIKIIEMIKAFSVPINGFQPFENAQICSGGIKTSEINSKSMESKLVSELYFAGEIVDVDGICGGYNLQWAWSSGYVAGLRAAQNYKTDKK